MTNVTAPVMANALYHAGFRGTDLVSMVAIGYAESGGNTDAVNPSSGALGLFQILPSAHPWIKSENWQDPNVNAAAAYRVYSEPPNPGKLTKNKWSTYGGLKYLAYLPTAGATVAALAIPGVSQATTVGGEAVQTAVNPGDWLKGLVSWLNPAVKTAGIAILGVTLLILGIELLISQSRPVTDVANTAKRLVK